MNNLQQYEKLFARDFSLPSIEAWVRGESINPKGWTEKKQQYLPYIITERSDNTVHFYYNLQGVKWVQDLLVKLAHKDKSFIPLIEKTVLSKLSFIRPIYEKEKSVDMNTLKRFLEELESGYPWFEAMWWFFQMDDDTKITDLNLKNLGNIRKLTDKLCNSSDTVIRKSLINSYPKLGELSSVLRSEEILTDSIPTKKFLEERYDNYFFGNNKLLTNLTKKDIARKFGINFKNEQFQSTKQITGYPAQQGKAKGRVCRLMGHSQIHHVREGDIIVSPMTIPDFLPAMKKAAAFITDEGGILCHAAIVAREWGKPCIVGTKIATQVFSDGDVVEVDAYKGTVILISE